MHRSSSGSSSAALCTSLGLGLFCLLPLSARAIGFDLIPPGAHEVGRGGASAVGADNAIGLFYNPATLLAPTTLTDTAVSLHMGFTDICYTGQEVVEAGGVRSPGALSPEICADSKTTFIPAVASTLRFGTQQRFAVSLGFYAPPAVGRDVKYGDPVVGTVDGGMSSALSPSRYMLMEEHLDQYFPTLGVAYQPARQLRLGASFGWGITTFDFTTATYSRVIASRAPLLVGGLSDVANQVKGTDAFVPRVQVGLWAQPLKSLPLELGASFTWTQEVESNTSTLRVRNLRTQYYSEPPAILGLLGTLSQPVIDARVENVSLNVPQVALLSTGVRYANKLDKPVGKKGDRLATERFDLEADFLVSFGKSLDRITVGIPATTITIPSPTPAAPDTQLALPTENIIEHQWQTQFGLKLGGDFNAIPGMLALRAGYSYETDGIRPGYHQLDFLPFERHGLYAGATVRLFDLLDLSAAYAYFVVPDVTNTVANAGLRRNVTGEPIPSDATISNAGTFSQDASALVVELAMHL